MLDAKNERYIIDIEDESYPDLLREISDPPQKLFCVGNISLLKNRKIAVVGSRKASPYGKWAAIELSKRISNNGITVVSGLAIGIDSCSHSASVEQIGSTIAVLGAGLNCKYPVSNAKLRRIIEEKGLVVTEYEDDIKPTKYTFPRRNRIISGMSEAIVVVEGGVNSGAVITAELAAEQGRVVYAIPGNINSEFSMATNKLIRDGATPLVFFDDILYDLGIKPKFEAESYDGLSEIEFKIVKILKEEGEVDINELYRRMGNDINKINGIISVLEIKGIIFSTMGKIFLAKI